MRTILILPSVLVLSACAGDHPDNVPQYGQWEVVNRIDSLTIDGIVIPPEQVPSELTSFNETGGFCGEPMFIESDWQQDDLARRTRGQCAMESYTFDAASAEGTGRCTVDDADQPWSPKFTLRSKFDEQSFRKVVTLDGSIVLAKDNSPHTIRVIGIQEGSRGGEC
jgi:hypothetical protein